MSLTLREVARGRRRFLQDLRTLMAGVDREQEQLERAIKRILSNPNRTPEPRDLARMLDNAMEIIMALDLFLKVLREGLPDGPYERRYMRTSDFTNKKTRKK